MGVNKKSIFSYGASESGVSMTEVLLALGVIAVATPFLYRQIASANHTIVNIAIANNIMSLRSPVLNFVRTNQDTWPLDAQIKLETDELESISDFPSAGFIDKYSVRGATITDVYLAFDLDFSLLRVNQIAKHIGQDAAVVSDDGIAYGASWAVMAPDFKPGNLIYRINRDITGQDNSIYLHRGTSGEDKLNQMLRNLNMGGNDILDVGTAVADSISAKNATATFVEAETLDSDSTYFSDGANLSGENTSLGIVRVTGDITGFRNIYADKFNDDKYTTNGNVITDRATITDSVNVSKDFILKSSNARTISSFIGLSAGTVYTQYISAQDMIFYGDFGLTVSGELLTSTTSPIKIGNWSFPASSAPTFDSLTFSRGGIPDAPKSEEFDKLMRSGWRSVSSVSQQNIFINNLGAL